MNDTEADYSDQMLPFFIEQWHKINRNFSKKVMRMDIGKTVGDSFLICPGRSRRKMDKMVPFGCLLRYLSPLFRV